MSPRARQAKGKARLNAYEKLLSQEHAARRSSTVEIYIPPGPRLGDVVVEAKDVRKGYGDKLLIDDLNFTLPPGGIVGVIGPNGAGKTTLFRMIIGQEKPDGGTLRARRDGASSATSIRAATLDGEQDRLGGDHRRRRRDRARQARGARRAPTSRWFNFKGARPAEEGRARSPAASATACTSPSC